MATKSILPSFGISRHKKIVQEPQHVQQQPQHQQPQQNQQPQHQVQGTDLIVPIANLNLNTVHATGKIVLNIHDGLLYYSVGNDWIPLSIVESQQNSGNQLVAADSEQYGQNILISSGSGGLNDGSINFDIGHEKAIEITKNFNFSIKQGALECPIAHKEITSIVTIEENAVEESAPESLLESVPENAIENIPEYTLTTSIPTIELDGMCLVLSLNCKINTETILTGKIKNDIVTVDSCINLTLQSESKAIPHAWITKIEKGVIDYSITSLNGVIDKIALHFTIILKN
jgi:hypothetical protein